ncbi:MAG TPA: hypothetical protein VFP70_02305 [Burkholderiales bacterium]|nr:hypothetical protein [Burkholderiales bacterium]
MPSPFRESYLNALTSGAHLVLLLMAVQIGTREAWLGFLSAVSLISFFAWIGNFRRHRLIGDTPTSRIASAAQGYTELQGRASAPPGAALLSKLTALPCLWFRYVVEHRNSEDKWERVDAGESGDTFLLRDGTGECVIDPEGAEIHSRHRQKWAKGDYRYTEWLLLADDPLYAIGEFSTTTGATVPLSESQDVGQLLAEWKQDRPRLLARFDLDGDGEINLREWALARAEARRRVAARHEEIRAGTPALHLLRAPSDGRMFLLTNLDPDRLVRKYRLWGIAHLLIFALAGMAVAWFSADPAACPFC